MLLIGKDKSISISRGDSRVIKCRFRFPSEAPDDGTIAVVTLKRDYNDKDKNKIWEKRYYVIDGQFSIILQHNDTADLLNDVTYYYDVQLHYADGQRWTLMKPTAFKILGVVGDAAE